MQLFVPKLAGAQFPDRLIACLGALVGIGLTAFLCAFVPFRPVSLPMIVAPMGASAVLLFGVPASPMAQPWAVLGGNVLSAVVGVAVALALGHGWIAAGVAVSAAILAMSLARCLHPPGGAAALTAVIGGPAVATAGFGLPVLIAINAVALLALGWLFHRFSGHSYPHRPAAPMPPVVAGLHRTDIDRALEEMGESFDIAEADLDALLQRAEAHALKRQAHRR